MLRQPYLSLEQRQKDDSERKDKRLYIKFNNAIEDMHCESLEYHYAEGFRFGFLMAFDVLKVN